MAHEFVTFALIALIIVILYYTYTCERTEPLTVLTATGICDADCNYNRYDCNNCTNCGYCVDEYGVGECVRGDANGATYRRGCSSFEYQNNVYPSYLYWWDYPFYYPYNKNDSWFWPSNWFGYGPTYVDNGTYVNRY